MKSYVRFYRTPKIKFPAARYRLIQPKIGYLYRAEGRILAYPFALSDVLCRDGAMLRVPPVSFIDIYYTKMLPQIRNDVEQEAAAVYFDPYAGQFIVVGSKQLYMDAKALIGTAGTPIFLEKETAFSFDPMTYGTYFNPDEADDLTYDDYFVPDVMGVTIADCMIDPTWDADCSLPAKRARVCATDFFVRYSDRLLSGASANGPDTLTTLLAALIAHGHYALLAQLFVFIPQLTARFRPTLQEESKFTNIRLPNVQTANAAECRAPRLFNLFQYVLLCGNPDIIETLFRFYERPLELSEFLRHPMYYHVGFYHVQHKNDAALSALLSKKYYPDAVNVQENRTPLLSYACRLGVPGIAAMLISAGCDITKRDAGGNTPFDYAVAANDCTALALLFSAMRTASPDRVSEEAAALAANLPLSDDNQALLGVLKKFLS